MASCSECGTSLPGAGRFCPVCGAEQIDPTGTESIDTALTAALGPDPLTTSSPASTSATAAGPSAGGGAFIPGSMVTDRYRIVGLLGRGGMGEVYRADDLKLGQPVALKFLPAKLAQRPGLLDRFLNEVRTALKVTHPNVCRVHDIGEVAGQHFLSMEYVDGEDLASLLRRIGRLPQERAVEVARQICAGLAAAHEQGILHRDLKPANVMIDGRGQARLTDFGLAGLADEIGQEDLSSGTPAYMAPEQLAGQEVSVRSDIYALGLVLYELFTGRPTFQADSLAELTDQHATSLPSRPSVHVEALEPAVERAVLHCLEKNPLDRPPSVLAVSAALPGGDPLAAALAAGETPSPELVAEAGRRDGMPARTALLLAAAGLLLFFGATRWAGTMAITNFLPLEKRPEVLMDRAQGILDELGYVEPAYSEPIDQAWGMILWSSIVDEVGAADSTLQRWEALRERPDAASFWYRQSPRLLLPDPRGGPIFTRGPVALTNPMGTTSGEAMVLLDLAGNLRRLEVLPKRFSTAERGEPDWEPLFEMAALDPLRFTEDRPRYQRFLAPDHRRAWVGSRPEMPDVELRVEAGSFEGRPVLFNVSTTGSLAGLSRDPVPDRRSLFENIFNSLPSALVLMVVLGAWYLSRKNDQQGRADRRGAARFAGTALLLFGLSNGLGAHVVMQRSALDEIWPLIVGGTFIAAIAWVLYVAAEPLGRRIWPTIFVSSSRLLSRPRVQWLDPLIGKSVLVGILAGGFRFFLEHPARWWIEIWVTGKPPVPFNINFMLLHGQREALSVILDHALLLILVLIFVVALVGIQLMVKRQRVALGLALVVWALLNVSTSGGEWYYSVLGAIISMVVLLRWGVVALFVSWLTTSIAVDARSPDLSAWHAEGAVLALVFMTALSVYGAWAATGGRRSAQPE